MAQELEKLFISVCKNEMIHELICEAQLPNKDWVKVEVTFEPIKRTVISELPRTYQPDGLEPRSFFRRSPHQFATSIFLHISKALQNYGTDVLPQFEEAAQILSEHGFPMEDSERFCA
ncbi:MAG: hypothetical protein WC087_01525 [Candidatus Paceibacterota bacterium]